MIEWFDDLKIGMRYKGGEAEITRDDIKRFAAEFDPQPFHLDEAAAEKTIFKGLAAWAGTLLRRRCGFSSPFVLSGRIRCWASPSTNCAGWLQFAPVTFCASRARWSSSRHLEPSRRVRSASSGRFSIKTTSQF